MKRKICVITGSRAEYDLLRPLLDGITKEPSFELQLAVTGSHLDERFGYTYQKIIDDGFTANAKIDLGLSNDESKSIAKALGTAVIGFTEALDLLKPDLIVVLGDRYEILGAANAALILRIPVAHLFGGDLTEGAFDDSIRHCISKISQIHFPTNEEARLRLCSMGENPGLVFNFGSPSLDLINETKFISKIELEKDLDFKFQEKNLLVTFHPETIADDSVSMFRETLAALGKFPDIGIIFTKANADPQGEKINRLAEDFVQKTNNAKLFSSLGSRRYLSVMKIVNAVLGNSSSGIYEAPVLKVPTINIGNRQKGRLCANSIINVECTSKEIENAISKAFVLDCSNVVSPYGRPGASLKILETLSRIKDYKGLVQKKFYEEP